MYKKVFKKFESFQKVALKNTIPLAFKFLKRFKYLNMNAYSIAKCKIYD